MLKKLSRMLASVTAFASKLRRIRTRLHDRSMLGSMLKTFATATCGNPNAWPAIDIVPAMVLVLEGWLCSLSSSLKCQLITILPLKFEDGAVRAFAGHSNVNILLDNAQAISICSSAHHPPPHKHISATLPELDQLYL